MRWQKGTEHSAINDNRLVNSIGSSYTIFKDGSDYFGECNFPNGSDITASSNASTVINNAIAGLPATGGNVHLKSGTYTLDTMLAGDSYVLLSGEGSSTVLTTTDPALTIFKVLGLASPGEKEHSCGIRDLRITYPSSATVTAIHLENVHNSFIYNVEIWGAYHGILLNGESDNTRIENCRIGHYVAGQEIVEDGIHIEDNCEHNVILGNTIESCGNNGINLKITSFDLGWGELFNTDNVIAGNTIEECYAGIYLTGSKRTTIVGNDITESDYDGIVVDGGATDDCYDTVINGNNIGNFAVGSRHGIYVFRGIRTTVTDNIVNNVVQNCLNIAATSSDTLVDGNIFEAGAAGNVVDNGVSTKWGVNIGWVTPQTIEHHTAADTLTKEESGSVHTNLGAGGNIKLTLPQDAIVGTYFEFAVMAANQLQIDPGAAGAIYINGAKQTDDKYVWADDEAESVKLVADGNGDWVAVCPVGTWGVEA